MKEHQIDHLIKYIHSEWVAGGVNYRFTLAWSVYGMEQEDHGDPCFTIRAGVAFCSPKDNFSKIKGRELAYAHLLSYQMCFRQYAGGAMGILSCFTRYLSEHGQDMHCLPRKVREDARRHNRP